MCDLFDEFLNFQKKTQEPMQFARNQKFTGGISWHDVHVATKVACKQNIDGSVQLNVNYFEKKWFLISRGLFRMPLEKQTVIVTQENFKEHWKLGAPSDKHRRLSTNDEMWNAVTFTNCEANSKKCFMFLMQIKEE